ncbi:hypothetical protein CG723_31355 [Streptomyces sp. CB01635]|uniref:hypothetical protein n=1 Tax=unclassified Streptomyces TaxID=2593676 RepID=UPI000C272FF1|nr:hypothetical protein [Streptomyces sp. CB01635]PJN07890.1 hypothetical protein CG723_31355 [Streptomyces sp. CB01635]
MTGGCGQERELLQAGGVEGGQGVGELLRWRIGAPHEGLSDVFAAHSAPQEAADERGLVGEGCARGQRRVDFWVVLGDRQQRFLTPGGRLCVPPSPAFARVLGGGRGPGWEDRTEHIENIDDPREELITAARALLIADGAL